ncbi:MAG: M81 family metallopeptidase [Polyangiaceae bacterium]
MSLRIAYGRLFHEANAFSPVLTELEDFERLHRAAGVSLHESASLRGVELRSFMPHAELTGFRAAARLAGGVEAIPLSSAMAIPSGPLTSECYSTLSGDLLDRLRSAGPLDGVYLALHGSMQVDGLSEAPEANLLARVRQVVGPACRIAVSYDLHANLSAGLVDPVDVLVAYRTNPHWDLAPTGYRAGKRLIKTIRGELRPTHAWRKLPMVLGGGMTIDFFSPMRAVFRKMKHLERDPRVVSASLFMVHPYTTAERIGWAAHVSTNADPRLADELADRLADSLWSVRDSALPPMRTPDEALDEVRSSLWRKLGPVTLVDVDDIVGAGAPGGNTRIVAALVKNDRGLKSLVPVHDPALVDELWSSPDGARHRCTLRGTPGYGSPPVELDVTIGARAKTDSGRTLRLDCGPIHIAITDRSPLPIHPSFWLAVGVSPREADVIVQKNFFHYRIFYATTSFRHLPVVTDGATSIARVRDRTYDIPMHPAARLDDWRPWDGVLKRGRTTTDAAAGASAR